MIKLTRLNKSEIVVNAELIQYLEETPDTVITLTTGNKIVVLENTSDIIERVIVYKRQLGQPNVKED
ncbi:flagellar protein FlbD [Tindallia magadiensis]|uniref:Flagellar protein FlbD n=1 Tax=Tindallia magadiensis TaxID=69895 RepID=A0A1I3AJJ5_9FIRM|nr:flagellar FlbD family protein [Tindallia magadiensis]SFH50160.1 flagellar protein FlbD [Tindallia magadiensis]